MLVLVLLVLAAVVLLVLRLVLVRQPHMPGVMGLQYQLQWPAPLMRVSLLVLLCQH
jgi:hypothetical protein